MLHLESPSRLTEANAMTRLVFVMIVSIVAISATVSCDKLKRAAPPLPKTEYGPPTPKVTVPKDQAPGASAVR